MALPSSGQISLNDFRVELGTSGQISFNDAVVRALIGKAAGAQASISEYYGASSEIVVTLSAASSVNAQTSFGGDWASATPKRLVIPSGVTIGTLTIPTGLVGGLIVDNSGEIQGLGGSVNGGGGGHAITAASSFILNNSGAVRGGGGGGGLGGVGGGGETSSVQVVREPETGEYYNRYSPSWYWGSPGICGYPGSYWNNTSLSNPTGDSVTIGIYTYYKGTRRAVPPADICGQGYGPAWFEYGIYRTYNDTVTTQTSGGAGGSGGVGQGYGQSSATGNAGSAGGTNAGTGGTGGSGGNWGAAGSTGATGANGNRTNGLAGSAGGAAGKAVHMTSGSVTVNNTGTINGAY